MSDLAVGPSGVALETVREGFRAFNEGRLDDVIPLYTEDLELHDIDEVPDSHVYRGHAGLRAWHENAVSAVDRVRFDLREIWEGENRLLLAVDASAVGHGGGVPVEWRVYMPSWLRDGRTYRVKGYLDRDAAFAEIGDVALAWTSE